MNTDIPRLTSIEQYGNGGTTRPQTSDVHTAGLHIAGLQTSGLLASGLQTSGAHLYLTRVVSALALVSLLFLFFSCASEPKTIPEDLEPIEYFQKAQHAASDDNNYSLAIRYYNTFIERHPDDFQRIIEAKYEIAFLHYKQGKLNLAEEEFNTLLENYEGQNANILPTWPRVLAKKVLKKIEEKKIGTNGAKNGSGPDSEEAS